MTKEMFGVRPMDLHTWKSHECGGQCERVYRADDVDAEIERLQARAEVDLVEGQAQEREIERLAQKCASDEAALGAIAVWLEQNQPDAFKRGLWDAIREARKGPFQLDARTDEPSASETPAPVCTCTPAKFESTAWGGTFSSRSIDPNCPIHWQQAMIQNANAAQLASEPSERLDAILGDRPRPRPSIDEMGQPHVREYEPEARQCQHDLLKPDTTVVVAGPYNASCPVCKGEWHLPHPTAKSGDNQ